MTVAAKPSKVFTPKRPHAEVPGAHVLGVQAESTDDLVQAIEQGLPFKSLENVASLLFVVAGASLLVGAAMSAGGTNGTGGKKSSDSAWVAGLALALLIGMSASTYQRRKKEDRLTPGESEGVYRYAALLERAYTVFGDEENARIWLNSPVRALGNRVPLEYAKTEPGVTLVMQILGRLELGSYS
jgi:putative toxin-antitoxin system antitoxin component (TIGR02293 family)